jgi:hypothetical protein
MLKDFPIHLTDLRAFTRLAVDATVGVTDVVENMHHNVSRLPGVFGKATDQPTRGISGFVYRRIRGVTRTVGGGIDRALGMVLPRARHRRPSARREALLAALNGVIGDHLHASANPLQITMRMRHDGRALDLDREALAQAIPQATGSIVVLAHGLCMGDLQWRRNGHDHGAALAAHAGFTPVYLHYNSGLHLAHNGHEFAGQLEALLHAWPVPVERLAILGYSMGGLVARSACDHARSAGHAWLSRLHDLVFLGTPHHGSPLERGGDRLDALLGASPYTVALSRLGKLRSAGITDLRDARLTAEDHRLPALPRRVRSYAIAGSIAERAGSLREQLLGDGLVPLNGALGLHADPARSLGLPKAHQRVVHGTSHLGLLDSIEASEAICTWLAKPIPPARPRRHG